MSSIARRTITLVGSSLLVFLLADQGLSADARAAELVPLAYVGPGAGLGALGALLAVLGAIVLCVAGLVLYPLQLLRKRFGRRNEDALEEPSEAKPSA